MKKNWIDLLQIDNYVESQDFHNSTATQFFDNYSIHDSYLIDIRTNGIDDVILIFQIDPFWSEEFKKYQKSEVKYWPYVLINFFGVTEYNSKFVNHSMQVGFSESNFEIINDKTKLHLIGTYGDEIHLTIDNKINILCFDYKYEIIKLRNV